MFSIYAGCVRECTATRNTEFKFDTAKGGASGHAIMGERAGC